MKVAIKKNNLRGERGMKKILIVCILLWGFIFNGTVVFADVIIDGAVTDIDTIAEKGILLIPLKNTLVAIGGEVTWNSDTNSVIASCNSHELVIPLNSNLGESYLDGIGFFLYNKNSNGTLYVDIKILPMLGSTYENEGGNLVIKPSVTEGSGTMWNDRIWTYDTVIKNEAYYRRLYEEISDKYDSLPERPRSSDIIYMVQGTYLFETEDAYYISGSAYRVGSGMKGVIKIIKPIDRPFIDGEIALFSAYYGEVASDEYSKLYVFGPGTEVYDEYASRRKELSSYMLKAFQMMTNYTFNAHNEYQLQLDDSTIRIISVADLYTIDLPMKKYELFGTENNDQEYVICTTGFSYRLKFKDSKYGYEGVIYEFDELVNKNEGIKSVKLTYEPNDSFSLVADLEDGRNFYIKFFINATDFSDLVYRQGPEEAIKMYLETLLEKDELLDAIEILKGIKIYPRLMG